MRSALEATAFGLGNPIAFRPSMSIAVVRQCQ